MRSGLIAGVLIASAGAAGAVESDLGLAAEAAGVAEGAASGSPVARSTAGARGALLLRLGDAFALGAQYTTGWGADEAEVEALAVVFRVELEAWGAYVPEAGFWVGRRTASSAAGRCTAGGELGGGWRLARPLGAGVVARLEAGVALGLLSCLEAPRPGPGDSSLVTWPWFTGSMGVGLGWSM